ncbi:MAG: hypothetical protein A2X12_06335 [Bacteroidetes bacterium GWE2_29_8]|nr:MAG: hypothetical protein A2X12_06335 [Bacteroidetes bacterium GWE2_29_8]OFY21222.1 MAG: hypothetical protein A2X02_10415 [Bacteroidetes bacterium GWF2_29_10]
MKEFLLTNIENHKALIMLLSTLIIVIGWIVNSWLNRKHEKFKSRLEYRLKLFHNVIELFHSMEKNGFNEKTNDLLRICRVNFQLYSSEDEHNIYENFVSAIESQDFDTSNKIYNKLIKISAETIRKELGLSKLKKK